jgi:hypothetical protein
MRYNLDCTHKRSSDFPSSKPGEPAPFRLAGLLVRATEEDDPMKIRIPAAIAAAFAVSQVAAPFAFAEAPATQFRSVEAQPFSSADLQSYGLSSEEAATVVSYQEQGYTVQLVTAEEAEGYNAGMSTNNVLAIVGLVVIVLVVASAI